MKTVKEESNKIKRKSNHTSENSSTTMKQIQSENNENFQNPITNSPPKKKAKTIIE